MNNSLYLDETKFYDYLRFFKKQASVEDPLLYELYKGAVELLSLHHETFKDLPDRPIDHGRLILYLLFDYEFRMKKYAPSDRIEAFEDDALYSRLISMVVDKYGSISYFKYEEGRLVTPYSMEISTLDVYLNFILLRISQIPPRGKSDKLYFELLRNAFSLCRTITGLLVDGFEKEALSMWRSLHELEAVLMLISEKAVLQAYEAHIIYHAAFNNLLTKEEGDKVFLEIKDKLRRYDLKSKDTRRFIEYGFITSHPDYDASVHKFNFRDGVEALAGLEDARDTFQVASEIMHSSPLVLLPKRSYFLTTTLSALYTSFLSIEGLFATIYNENGAKNEVEYYLQIRAIYLEDIKSVQEYFKRTPQNKKAVH